MSGLPIVPASALPADIRTGSPERKKSYEAALGFERVLLQQLTKSLSDTAQPADDSSDDTDGTDATTGSDTATQTYQSMLPDTLADSIVSAGGLGLARALVPAEPQQEQGQ